MEKELEKATHIGPAFTDDRGDIINIFEGQIEHIAYITSKAGSVRANHYHKNIHQYIYLVSGEFDSYSCDIDNPQNKQKINMQPGDLVDTPPLVGHAQKFLKDSVFIALSTRKRHEGKYEQDTISFQVIEGYINPELQRG